MSAAPEQQQETPGVAAAGAHPSCVVRRGMDTIWGPAQHAKNLIPGVGLVTTAGHGGIIISESRKQLLPEYMRVDGHSYEEDEAWCIIFTAFEAELLESGDADAIRCIREGKHTRLLKDWHPEIFERYFGVTLQPGESHVKDERLFREEHADDFITTAAWGDWHAQVPTGMVGVLARKGGRGISGDSQPGAPREFEERYFLVPEDEYDKHDGFGFVIDTARHAEIEPIK